MSTWESMTTLPLGTRPNIVTPLAPALTGTIRIMCGPADSITYGYGPTANTVDPRNNAWRYDLYSLLTDPARGNLAVEFIGPQSNTGGGGVDSDPWRLSRGVVGASVPDHQSTIDAILATYDPHVFIILLGLNDAQDAGESAAFAANLDALVDQCRTAKPNARFVVCCPPDGLGTTNRTRLHDEVWTGWEAALATLTTADVPYVPCDLRVLSWGPDHNVEPAAYTHPNAIGYPKLAQALYPAVMNACGYAATW